jgi:hypothetical protein
LYSPTVNASEGFGEHFQFLTFSPGSGDGALMCSSISILPDAVIEQDEKFIVALALVTAMESVILGNNDTTITIKDDDGM